LCKLVIIVSARTTTNFPFFRYKTTSMFHHILCSYKIKNNFSRDYNIMQGTVNTNMYNKLIEI